MPSARPPRSRAPSCASPTPGRPRGTGRRARRGAATRSPAASCRGPCRRRGWRGGVQEERDAFDLVREESVGERSRLAPGVVEVVWRAAQQLRERRSLGVEGGVCVDRDRVLWVHRACPFDEVPLGAERFRPSRMGPGAVPGRLGHRELPRREQDDGMARGSWSRCSGLIRSVDGCGELIVLFSFVL